MTEVVAALIWDHDRFLACQRPAHKARGLLWEFVGGKVEPGESREAALIRECREELDVTVTPGTVFMELVHEYPDITIRLTLFNAVIAQGQPRRLEHNDIRWITTGEIDDYAFCPADADILSVLKTVDNGVQAQLISIADPEYKRFQSKLMPTVAEEKVLGVRIPALRHFTKKVAKQGNCEAFLNALPHKYYEEDNLHAILISGMTEYAETVSNLNRFLPYVDNWATCDMISPTCFRTCPDGLEAQVRRWLTSGHTYTVRFGIGVLLKYYLDDKFKPDHLQWVAGVALDEYYVKMMAAWYFATALAKQYNQAVPYLQNQTLTPWIHNKTIQKAVESYRIKPEQKAYLKTLKIRKR